MSIESAASPQSDTLLNLDGLTELPQQGETLMEAEDYEEIHLQASSEMNVESFDCSVNVKVLPTDWENGKQFMAKQTYTIK